MTETQKKIKTTSLKRQKELATVLNHFYQNPVTKVSLELFLTIGLVLFLAVFAIKPTILTMSDLIKEIEDKEKLEKQLIQKIAALQSAQSEYLSVENQIYVLDEAIPSSPEIIRTAKILEKIVTESNVVMKNMGVSELPSENTDSIPFSQKSKQNVGFSLSITGDYVSIRNFVETLRNSRKSFVVDSVTFILEERKGTKKLNANITLSVPYFGTEHVPVNKK